MTYTYGNKTSSRMPVGVGSSRKRNWRDGAGAISVAAHSRDSTSLLARYRSSLQRRLFFKVMKGSDAMDDDDEDNNQQEDDDLRGSVGEREDHDDAEENQLSEQTKLTLSTMPMETVGLVLAFLDGESLLMCRCVCRTMEALAHNRQVWKNICVKKWPVLKTQVLPQLPGAPDYDLIRLYGGSWERCYLEKNQHNQRAEIEVTIPNFSSCRDRIVSETFAIEEHHFCLWIFPKGNPNENEYKGRVLSVYLVLTDLEMRPYNWLTCAVFTLCVVNHKDENKRIEWHSCLVDNKFNMNLINWGVHSLGTLEMLNNPQNGFLNNDALTIRAKVRLMTITFQVVFEQHLKDHHHLGLVDFTKAEEIVVPFCSSLNDLLNKMQEDFNLEPDQTMIWCFNQPVISGQALRPRKLLTSSLANKNRAMFGHLLCDGIDIDAYSCCQIFVEQRGHDDEPMEVPELVELQPEYSRMNSEGYLFVKLLNPATNRLDYLGKVRYSSELSTSHIYECAARCLGYASSELLMFKEEIAPIVCSGPILWDSTPAAQLQNDFVLQPADIAVFVVKQEVGVNRFRCLMNSLLLERYHEAQHLLQHSFAEPTLQDLEILGERLDIPKFRVRSAFRKCSENGRKTLAYIMEGRHLGFICDSCGETDFKGARYNCYSCTDYDLCGKCNVESQEITHRYANVDGKWQRIYDFQDHRFSHRMREYLPVFYQYTSQEMPAFLPGSTPTNSPLPSVSATIGEW